MCRSLSRGAVMQQRVLPAPNQGCFTDWQTFSAKGQVVAISGFVTHMVSVATYSAPLMFLENGHRQPVIWGYRM